MKKTRKTKVSYVKSKGSGKITVPQGPILRITPTRKT
jgi:hypothetical protein